MPIRTRPYARPQDQPDQQDPTQDPTQQDPNAPDPGPQDPNSPVQAFNNTNRLSDIMRGAGQGPGNVPQGGNTNTYKGGFTNTDSITEAFKQNRMNAQGEGQAQMDRAAGQADMFGGQYTRYGGLADQAYGALADQPGFRPDLAGQINVDYSKFRTPQDKLDAQYYSADEQKGIMGDPYANLGVINPDAVTGTAQDSGNRQMAAAGDEATDLRGAVDPSALTKSAGQFGQAAGSALDTEAGALGSAVNNPNLQLDPNFASQYEMSPQQQQDIVNQAARSAGVFNQSQQDAIARRAAMQGNTSPAALASMENEIAQSGAVATGDAETNARIAAQREAASRLKDVQGMELGAAQTQAGLQTGAAETLGGQRVGAAGQQAGLEQSGQQFLTQAQMDAIRSGDQAKIQAAFNAGNQQVAAEEWGQGTTAGLTTQDEAAQAARAKDLASNRQNVDIMNNQTQYNQNMQTTGATAAGAQTVGSQEIAGQNQVRGFLTDQQKAAQSGMQTATGQGIGAYGATTGAVNAATSGSSQHSAQPGVGQQVFGTIMGAAGNAARGWAGGHEKGGIITEPTETVVGEKPEMIVKLPRRYGIGQQGQKKAA